MLVPTHESKEILKILIEMWDKIRNSTRLITTNPDDYDEKYMKTKFNSEDDLPLHKTLELRNMVIIVRSIIHEGKKYYPHVFLHECYV